MKLKMKTFQRWICAILKGDYFLFGLKPVSKSKSNWSLETVLTLPILESPMKEGKLQNLQIAINKINERVLDPGRIFSFWNEIGNPTAPKGYTEGRVIRNGMVSSEVAGGLCQLSGIIYYLSLELGLQILERFPHSRDLYNEETRFTPLGTDASVVYPSKDLRIKNTYPFPLFFSWELKTSELTFRIKSPEPIKRNKLHFQQTTKNGFSNVQVFIESKEHGELVLCSSDDYRL